MDFLMGAPVLVKVLGSLGAILALNTRFRRLALSLCAGTLLLALWCGHGPSAMGLVLWRRMVSWNNLFLLVVIWQVTSLGAQMSATGVMDEMVSAVRSKLSQRVAMGLLPALIGLLPMPGGALFSAPLVDGCDGEGAVPPLLKSQINYWFRHVWEYWWPLYPGVLLALHYTKLEVWQMILLQLPLSVVAIGGGYIFLLRRIPAQPGGPRGAVLSVIDRRFVALLSPIITVVGVYTLVRLTLPAAATWNRYLPMAIGIAAAMLLVQWQRPVSADKLRTILFTRRQLSLVGIVMLVRAYGAFIEAPLANGVPLVETMRSELGQCGIPVMAIVMLLPFISGLASGLAIGFVGASFPIVVSLLGSDPTLCDMLATTALAYGFGQAGMMLSPVHVCLIVTNEHFATRLLHSLAGLLPPAFVVMVSAVLLHGLLRALSGC
ncbi:MAG: DUF401 family protein [Lentisphaerae bacterium]|mgnify:CR=1 FL=1|jgi:uncharacterized protein|nr:DUF401 family protein [Lentisphaerota bacterium]MBT4820337.1 DUF401 family protein [Lentisphaerota bacterium]MBT7053654.1 DUF401 family protein [Lentisphaerota bacterium]MBT7842033.1 DUF401 family protein [Lentisphaerota bacterium]